MPFRLPALIYYLALVQVFSTRLSAQQSDFQPAAYQSPDVPQRLMRIQQRLDRDIAKLPQLPKDHRTAIIEQYTERADSVKSQLKAGHFLMDSTWTSWFQNILQEIYRGNPGLPSTEIALYVGRDEEPNAWCVGEGTIVFNIGLLPYMENESQVAFIICHELAHFTQHHGNLAIEQYINQLYSKETQKKLKAIERQRVDKQEKTMGLLQGMTYSSRRHSRFKETEADSLGFALLANTRYNKEASWKALRMLDSIDRFSWPEVAYKNLLHSPQFPFQDVWLTGPAKNSLSLQAAAAKEAPSANDSLRTHPDCQKRMALIKRQMDGQRTAAGAAFLQHENTFHQLKTWSQYEMIEANYHFRDYGRCLFRSLVLLQQYPEDAYLNAMVVKCLYYIHQYQEAHALRAVLDLPKPGYSAEYRKFLQFVNRLQLSEIAKIGYFYCQNRLDKYTGKEDFLFAAALASHMQRLPDEFKSRKEQYQKQYPQGKFKAALLAINP